jgi:hypothetical protein
MVKKQKFKFIILIFNGELKDKTRVNVIKYRRHPEVGFQVLDPSLIKYWQQPLQKNKCEKGK